MTTVDGAPGDIPTGLSWHIETCRSCPQPIIWAVSVRGLADMPVNAYPEPGGNIRLIHRSDGIKPIALIVKPDIAYGATNLRKSHAHIAPRRREVA